MHGCVPLIDITILGFAVLPLTYGSTPSRQYSYRYISVWATLSTVCHPADIGVSVSVVNVHMTTLEFARALTYAMFKGHLVNFLTLIPAFCTCTILQKRLADFP